MKENGVKSLILKHLEHGRWEFGGSLCRAIHEQCGAKEGVIEKRARELCFADGKLDRQYVEQTEEGIWVLSDREHGVVQFRVKIGAFEKVPPPQKVETPKSEVAPESLARLF